VVVLKNTSIGKQPISLEAEACSNAGTGLFVISVPLATVEASLSVLIISNAGACTYDNDYWPSIKTKIFESQLI
jgi:hypothetical protein